MKSDRFDIHIPVERDGCNIRFSVIIPAYNAEKTLPFCLEALSDQTFPGADYEIIVVDDGSTDETAKVVRRFRAGYIYQLNKGPASARNRGANAARGQIILFTDSDCVPQHSWIEEMTKPFEGRPEIIGVKGIYKTRQRQLTARFAQAEFEDRYDRLRRFPYIDMIDTYSAAFRRDKFLEAGGFDKGFPVANNEDTELSYRLASAGCKMVFNPRAVVYHTHPDTLRKYLLVKFWRGYWRIVVYRRYPGKAIKDTYTPAVIKMQATFMAISFPLLAFSVIAKGLPWKYIFVHGGGRCMFVHELLILLAVLLWLIIIALSFPFSFKTFKKDRAVGLISPLIVFLRSIVFAAGSLSGGFRCLFSRRK
ncbi:glycosyltransferase [bacterium]|nr:glycosyltransferase [bacterium]